MQILMVELTHAKALKAIRDLEQQQLIRIIKDTKAEPFALPGEPMSDDEFKKWVDIAEASTTVSLSDAKQRWETQKQELWHLIH
jgi:hypothetical protein